MPKISNQDIYNQDDTLSMNDYTIGSNSNTGNKKTQTYTFASIFSLFYNFLGYNAFLNTTDTTTYPIGTPGCFYVFDENDVLTADFSEARKITFSSYDTYNFDTANYFNIIVSSGKFLFKLINLEDKNNFVFLKPSNFVLGVPGTTFDVDVLAESGLSNGSFVNYKRYLLVLEFAAGTFNPADYDLSDFTNTSGNPFITAQDLTYALALLPTPITNHSGLSLDDGTNPHGTTKGDVGLGNVQNIDTSTTSNISEGSNLYFTTARVLATVLSGLSLATGGTIVSTDTVLQAFGKLQKQINDLVSGKLDKVTTGSVRRIYGIDASNNQEMIAVSDLASKNTQIFHWWGGNWTTTTLGNYYYIGYNGGAIEGLNNSISASMNGRNKGLFIAPFNCKIKRVIFKEGGSGSYTGAFVLASGLPNYGGTWNNGYTNVVTHLNQAISAAGYEQHKNEFLVTDNITVPKGYAVCPMLVFSAQVGASKVGVEISVEIEEVV